MCAAWVKYVLLMILFIFSFYCMFSPVIDIYGFGSFFVVQTIFAMFVLIDMSQDDAGNTKVLLLRKDSKTNYELPFSWILLPVACLEFLASHQPQSHYC